MKKIILTAALIYLGFSGRAQIKVYTGGKAAFGSTSTTPNYNIDVITGDINVNSSGGYRINGNYVLQQKNINSCIFVGSLAGNSTTGINNTAVGHKALYTNTTGTYNDAFGDSALYANTGTSNLGMGAFALTANTSGNNNSAVGAKALFANTTGSANVAFGFASLSANTSNNNSSAFGYEALINSTGAATGDNTAMGCQAGKTNTTGDENTYLGSKSDANANNYNNSIAVGYAATIKASNYAVIGNSSSTSIGGYVGWTTYVSDARCKKNVQTNVPGLAFIKKLRPVTYNLDLNQIAAISQTADSVRVPKAEAIKAQVVYSGFIAQEVERAAQQLNYNFSGNYIPQNPNDLHGLTYSDFVVPLVKAVQEQSSKVDSLTTLTHQQDSINRALQNQINQIITNCCNNGTLPHNINSGSLGAVQPKNVTLNNTSPSGNSTTSAMLYQNNPNPFNQTTVVKCLIPQNTQNASLLIFDMNGSLKKTIPVNGTGETNTTINGNQLVSGMYYYTLLIDGQEIDTKKMILTE